MDKDGAPEIVEIDAPGLYLVGAYLGVKEPSTWTPPGESREVAVPPKLGVDDGEREYSVRLGTLADLAAIAPGVQKGQRIAVAVRVFPARDGRGLNYVWAGLAAQDGGGRWT